jgi:hypothetical protein
MLSDGTWPWGTSTSLLVSPVVELAAAAGVEPKSAIITSCGETQVGVREAVVDRGAVRARVVMRRCESAKIPERARWVVRVTVDRSYWKEGRQLVGDGAQLILSSAS